MKIDKDLIERYHRQECSPEERQAVELWLFSADSEEALQLPLSESKAHHKAEIWEGIESALPQPKKMVWRSSFWSGAAAATVAIGIFTFGGLYLTQTADEQPVPTFVSVDNPSPINVKHVSATGYDISVGTNTSAHIDNLTGAVDLKGSLLIRPKQDIELKFNGSPEKVTLKTGQTYIILKGKDGSDMAIILTEKNIINLPPVLQKQIINEFDI